jgi:hypothetical protein
MPRDFLCPCQPRFLGISRGEIFCEKLFRSLKADPLATDFHPGTGMHVCRNWDGAVMHDPGRVIHAPDQRGAAFRVSLHGTTYSACGVLRPNRVVSRGSLEACPAYRRATSPWRGTGSGASRVFVDEKRCSRSLVGHATRHCTTNATPLPPSSDWFPDRQPSQKQTTADKPSGLWYATQEF